MIHFSKQVQVLQFYFQYVKEYITYNFSFLKESSLEAVALREFCHVLCSSCIFCMLICVNIRCAKLRY